MFFATALGFMMPDTIQCQLHFQSKRIKCTGMSRTVIFRYLFNSNSSDTADRICKIFINKTLFQTDRFKDFCTLIRLNGGNSHLGGNLYNSADNRMVIIVNCSIIIFLQHISINKLAYCLMCKIRIDRTCTIAKQCCKMMDFSRFSCFQNNSHGSSLLCPYQMLLKS